MSSLSLGAREESVGTLPPTVGTIDHAMVEGGKNDWLMVLVVSSPVCRLTMIVNSLNTEYSFPPHGRYIY